ncbi:MAG: hypothetical protein Q9157_003808 [Trypethelium eluteriae]
MVEEPSNAQESNQYPGLIDYLVSLQDHLKVPEIDLVRRERILISLASTIDPFRRAQHDDECSWITEIDIYKRWLTSTGFQILHVHGTHGVHETSEEIFYSLDNHFKAKASDRHLVLYFSFDRWDRCRNSIKHMLATFLAQILHRDRSGSDLDLLQWFELFRLDGAVDNVSCVVNYIDECTETSQKGFIELLSRYAYGSEATWKIAITSRQNRALVGSLDDSPSIHLDVAVRDRPQNFEEVARRISDLRSDVSSCINLSRKDSDGFGGIDSVVHHVLYEQAKSHGTWPAKSLNAALSAQFNSRSTECRDYGFLELILDNVLRDIPDQNLVRRILTCTNYSTRPLTVWEMVTALSAEPDQGRNEEAFPVSAESQSLITFCERWFAGIIEVRQNEVRVCHPHIRDIFMTEKAAGGSERLWHGIRRTAQFEIITTCFHYLSRPDVQRMIEQYSQATDSNAIEASCFPKRDNFCSYAIQSLPYHYSLTCSWPNSRDLFKNFMQSAIGSCWVKGYWTLSNPVTRPQRCFKSPYPIFIGLGVPNEVRLESGEDLVFEDLAMGLVEAAKHARVGVVEYLLKQEKYSQGDVLDALAAAGSSGDEQIMLGITNHIVAMKETGTINWPPALLYRAAWLGLHRFAEKLLELGCVPEPDFSQKGKFLLPPLFLAVEQEHISTAHVLLKHNADTRSSGGSGNSVLHYSATTCDANIIKLLLQEGNTNLEAKNKNGKTALYLACVNGYHETTKALLSLNADPDMDLVERSNEAGWTPLVAAADSGYVKCVRALLEKGANPNIQGPSGIDTPLRYAAFRGYSDICHLLLESGADPNSPPIQPPIIVELATFECSLSASERAEMITLLTQSGALVDSKDGHGETALHSAVRNGNDLLVKCLVENGADVNCSTHRGWTPLCLAVDNRNEDLVELLLSRGAEVNCEASSDYTLFIAAQDDSSILRLLLEKGADPDTCTNAGLTPLMSAARNSCVHAVRMLLEHNATLDLEVSRNDQDNPGWTAMSFAVESGHVDIVRLLGDAGANLNHRTGEGLHPIHQAREGETLRALLEYRKRIDTNQVTPEGETALCRMIQLNRPIETVKLLVNAGANLNIQDCHGDTALSEAAWKNNQQVVSLLLREDDLDINLGSQQFGSALHQACMGFHTEVVKLLVENGADVNYLATGVGGTPLQVASWYLFRDEGCSYDIIEYLIGKGAYMNSKRGKLSSPINYVALSGTTKLVNLL